MSLFSQQQFLKKVEFDENPFNNYIYGPNNKTAMVNIIISIPKFNHHLKKYFKYKTDLHYPSFF